MVYLFCIHPRHWVVFANRKDLAVKIWFPAYLARLQAILRNLGIEVSDNLNVVKSRYIDSTVPIGKKFPLFGISRNNMSEGGASQVNGLGIRSLPPLFAIHKMMLSAKRAMSKYRKEVEDIEPSQIPFTSIGVKLFQDSVRDDDSLEVVSAIPDPVTDGLFFNLQVQVGRQVYNVKLTRFNGSCDCRRYLMYNCICVHSRKGITHLVAERMLDLTDQEEKDWVLKNMPNCFSVSHVKFFFRADTEFSFCGMVDEPPTPVTDTVYPPPRYRNRKTSSNRRIRSTGETGGPSVIVSSQRSRSSVLRRTLESEPVSRTRFTRNAINALNDLASDNFFNIFSPDHSISRMDVHHLLDQVLHRSTLPSNFRICGQCGVGGHNIRTCPDYLSGGRHHRAPKLITPGWYRQFKVPANVTDVFPNSRQPPVEPTVVEIFVDRGTFATSNIVLSEEGRSDDLFENTMFMRNDHHSHDHSQSIINDDATEPASQTVINDDATEPAESIEALIRNLEEEEFEQMEGNADGEPAVLEGGNEGEDGVDEEMEGNKNIEPAVLEGNQHGKPAVLEGEMKERMVWTRKWKETRILNRQCSKETSMANRQCWKEATMVNRQCRKQAKKLASNLKLRYQWKQNL
jgi:hypothetical protein